MKDQVSRERELRLALIYKDRVLSLFRLQGFTRCTVIDKYFSIAIVTEKEEMARVRVLLTRVVILMVRVTLAFVIVIMRVAMTMAMVMSICFLCRLMMVMRNYAMRKPE